MIPTPWTDGRRLVPRWRGFAATAASLELAQPAKVGSSVAGAADDTDYIARLERWRLHPSLITAAELLEASIVAGSERDAIDAARRLIEVDKNATPLIHAQAVAVLGRHEGQPQARRTDANRSPRHLVRLNPRDPMAWVELALRQVSTNHVDAARHSMRVARALAPENRHVLRSAARLYLHAGRADQAHDVLVRSPATPSDPWLMAAEIAVAEVAGRNPRFVKAGQRMLGNRAFAPRQLTELAGSIATDEFLSGNRKMAKRNFEFSMRDPTGSALAQGEWAAIQTGSEFVSTASLDSTLEAAEARAFHLHRTAAFALIPSICREWAGLDVFSIRPYEFGTSTAGVLGDHASAMELAADGLKIRPSAPSLLNAMAFSLASTERADEAITFLQRIRGDDDGPSRCVTAANWGLVAFRSGDEVTGRDMYRRAIEGFEKLQRPDLAVRARLYLTREVIAAGAEDAEAMLREARTAAKKIPDAENDYILRVIDGVAQPAVVQVRRREPKVVVATFPNGEQMKFPINPK